MIINLISGPRNISTALMYSFAQREDTKVLDEPFYAHYLDQFPELNHPGRAETLKSMPIESHQVLEEIHREASEHRVLFLKNMAHHHLKLDWEYMREFKNIFLIRNPKQLIASFAQVIEHPTLQDIGLKEELELYEYTLINCKHLPIVVESATILQDPEKGLELLCQQIGIPFTRGMLTWKKGGIPEDGVWAKYWYKNVQNSEGFVKQSTSDRALPEQCLQLYELALPYYEKLMTKAIQL